MAADARVERGTPGATRATQARWAARTMCAAALLVLAACSGGGTAPAGAGAPGAAPSQAGGARAAIDAANADTGRLVAAGDGAAVGRQYTADGELLPAHGEAIRGPEAIGRQFQATIDAGLRGLTLTADQVEDHGDTAIEYGRYAATGAEGAPLDRGKYVVIWKSAGGAWKRRTDIWTTSLPAPGVPEATSPPAAAPAP